MVVVLVAAVALVAAACGDDADDDAGGGDGGTTTTAAGADDEAGGDVAMGPATLEVEDQSGSGATVVVASVTLPSDGFIAVHADADGSPGPVIGHSELLTAGTSTDVEVVLDEPLAEDAAVWPMAHIDTNGNGTYDFDPPDVTDDGPATFEDGSVAVAPLDYTVEEGDDDAASGTAAAVAIEGFAYLPTPLEVAVGTTVTWTNEDGVEHTVTHDDGEFGDSVPAGGELSVTFDETGTYEYFCGIHPAMVGEIVVS